MTPYTNTTPANHNTPPPPHPHISGLDLSSSAELIVFDADDEKAQSTFSAVALTPMPMESGEVLCGALPVTGALAEVGWMSLFRHYPLTHTPSPSPRCD